MHVNVFSSYVCVYSHARSSLRGRKRALYLLELESQMVSNHYMDGCWELNLGCLQEQQCS